jgi:hypothetical protein
MVQVAAARIQIGLTPREAERLADELARMEERHHEPGLGAFRPFDLTTT